MKSLDFIEKEKEKDLFKALLQTYLGKNQVMTLNDRKKHILRITEK